MLKKHMMDRRAFLGFAGAAGVMLTAPPLVRRASAASAPFTGPYWLFVHASGGWDPTMLCDPKGTTPGDLAPVNNYLIDDIGEAGPFQYAPIAGHREFFERFQNDLLVINGVDTQTNSHEVGTRHTWSGSMTADTPALGALVPGLAPTRPSLAFLSNGGYDLTGGLVAPTRLGSTSTILQLAYPGRLDVTHPETELFTADTTARIAAARAARLDRQIAGATLPRVQNAWALLRDARLGDNELAQLAETLPTTLDNGSDLRRQAQVAMACFAAGVTVSATLQVGGYDTHGDHDRSHTTAMQGLINGLMFAMDEAEAHGIAQDVIVVVGSDFGRTPWYNDGMGKDHWSISSMMLMGPGIRGGRVIGGTDSGVVPVPIDPATLRASDTGVRITPGDVHADLRALAGLQGRPELARWSVGNAYGLLG